MSSNPSSDSDFGLLIKIAQKLALDDSDKLTKKGYEYLRLLKIKKGSGMVNLSDTCAVVVCLNLAADKLEYSFDRSHAIKVAGVTKKNYTNLYHTVEKVLGLDKPVAISELCVKLACTDVTELARRLIDQYVSKREQGLVKCAPIDLNHPMYACAAVLAACRHRKVKIKKDMLVEQCRIKTKDLEKLAADLTAIATEVEAKPSRKRGHHLIDMVEQMVNESQKAAESVNVEEEENDDNPQESFEEWKKRILAKA